MKSAPTEPKEGRWRSASLDVEFMSVCLKEDIISKVLVIFPNLLIPAGPKVKLLSCNMKWITQTLRSSELLTHRFKKITVLHKNKTGK